MSIHFPVLANYTVYLMPRKSLIEARRPKGRRLPGKVVSFCIVPPSPRPKGRVSWGTCRSKRVLFLKNLAILKGDLSIGISVLS
jgi:hypothetical protein